MLTALSQAIQSRDEQMLDEVLSQKNRKVIEETLDKLSTDLIVPFLDILVDRLESKSSYLSLDKQPLKSLRQFLDSRCLMLSQFQRLEGRLQLALKNHKPSLQKLVDDQDPIIVVENDIASDDDMENILLKENDEPNMNFEEVQLEEPLEITPFKRHKQYGTKDNKKSRKHEK